MSRGLAQLLGVNQPAFRLGLTELEKAAGYPKVDIRLMLEINQAVRDKLRELKLDPNSTTGRELYHALLSKLSSDEKTLRQALGVDETPVVNLLEAVAKSLEDHTSKDKVFVIKQSVMRTMMKKLKPKNTMKALGYRSMDSMIKHESMIQLVAAADIIEDAKWQSNKLKAYKSLKASDFEMRSVQFVVPLHKKWPELAEKFVKTNKHNILTCRELGGVLILPLKQDLPGLATTAVLAAMTAFAEIRTESALLKLHLVRPDFNDVFIKNLQGQPTITVPFGSNQLGWQLVYSYYSAKPKLQTDVFSPHLYTEDFKRRDPSVLLKKLHSSLGFWQGGHKLIFVDGSEAVSLNMFDVALALCNNLSYGDRIVHYSRGGVNRELVVRYLDCVPIKNRVESSLASQLVTDVDFEIDLDLDNV